MKKAGSFSCFFIFFSTMLCAQKWYVSGAGSNDKDGKSLATAFRTLQKAADLVKPGDVVLVGNGLYTNVDQTNGSAVLKIHASGNADSWITWKAIKGETPIVNPRGWAGIQVTGSYNIIDGFHVIGNNDSIYLLEAQEDAKKSTPNPYFNSNDICFEGRNMPADKKPHHLVIRNCEVSKCAGGAADPMAGMKM